MTKHDSIKKPLFSAVVSLLLCFSMLLGTTFAWFTDSVTSAGNIIQSGSLDIEMYWAEGKEDPTTVVWNDASEGAIFDYDKWEPGYAEVRHIKIENNGTLALAYKIAIVANGEVSDLSDVIDVYYLDPAAQITDRDQLTDDKKLGTLTDVLANLAATGTGALAKGESDTVTLALKMQEGAGNEYQEKSIGSSFSVQLLATQLSSEFDSFGDDYDAVAVFPKTVIRFSAKKSFDSSVDTATGETINNMVVGDNTADIFADVPAGVKVADGQDGFTLSVNTMKNSEANVTLADGEVTTSLDVHVGGLASDNTVPVQVTLKGLVKPGLNDNNIKLYHVENGATVQMTHVALAELDAHNEFYYNAATGDVIVSMASFSEVAVVADTVVHWDGLSDDEFAGGDGTANKPYLIANASQLAYFRDLVDGGKTFKGEYVKLAGDIILNHHGETRNQFDPIGWGYDNAAYNRDGVAGKVFMGTFDGGEYDANGKVIGRHGIHGLWQNGWDLQDPDNDGVQDADYTYTNCGFGLFASVKDATIKNLEIKHANVTVECVEAGLVVGLAQGNCTFQNLYVYSSHIANYQRPAGGVVGEVSPRFENGVAQDSTVTFDNVHVGSSCTVGSLWGDFDTPCGGVIGAYWDDAGKTRVHMKDVDVSCVLDVYNDVTAAYQWYAYRRAGMLIGNTDQPPADGKNAKVATADFLTCENCIVIYDYWRDYKYCQFTNDNNPGKGYPWVRIQASQYNGAYSNPRYGHPVDNAGVTVTNDNHQHKAGDTCHEYIPFNQLYGGGQGVYGQPAHPGVTIGKYVVVYMIGDEIHDVKYVADNAEAFNDFLELESGYDWVDMYGNHYVKGGETKISAGNTTDYVLYKNTINTRMIRFVDARGFVVSEQLLPNINKNNASESDYKTFYEGKLTIPEVPHIDGYVGVWPEWWKIIMQTPADQDVAVHAVYTIVYEGDTGTDDKGEIVILDETNDMGDIFTFISQGKSVVMYKPLSGTIGNASKVQFATTAATAETATVEGWVSAHARLDLDANEFIYANSSSANKDWSLFKINEGASLTIGGGINGSGKLSFVFNSLNGNAKPALFKLEHNASTDAVSTLHLERGVTIEMKFKKSLNIDLSHDNIETLITGHSHPEGTEEQYHPGIDVQVVEEGDYDVIRIVCTSYTTFVGNTVTSNY